MVTWLADDSVFEDDELDGAAHANRPALEAAIESPSDDASWETLRADYTEQAPEWAAWADAKIGYGAPLLAGLRHARPATWLLEVGAGSDATSLIPQQFGAKVLVSDITMAMLRLNPAERRLACDVRRLPFRTGSLDLVCGLNAVPHFGEFQRVLANSGQLVWANSFRERTPMYVAPEELERRMPGWTVTAQRVAAGEWCLIERE